MTSPPSRGEEDKERKTLCTHSSMSVSNYCPTNHWQGSIGSIWDGVVGERGLQQHDRGTLWGTESLKMPWDKRITDQYGRMDFVILKMAVRAVHSHLLRTQSNTPVHYDTPPRIPSSLQLPWISEGISNVNQECLGLPSFELQSSTPSPLIWLVYAWQEGRTYLGDELNRKQRSPLFGCSSL